jgi:hypothetical protein
MNSRVQLNLIALAGFETNTERVGVPSTQYPVQGMGWDAVFENAL